MTASRREVIQCGAAAMLLGATTLLASPLAEDSPAPVLAGLPR